jgi:hypothetical protein
VSQYRHVYYPDNPAHPLHKQANEFADRTSGDDLYDLWQDEKQDDDVRKLAWQEHILRIRTPFLVPSPWSSEEAMQTAWEEFRARSFEGRHHELNILLQAINGADSTYVRGRTVELFPSNDGRDQFGRFWNFLKRTE